MRVDRRTFSAFVACVFVYGGAVVSAGAEDLNAIFNKVNEYVAQENYAKALNELGWANKEIEKLHTVKLTKLLPAEVAGFKGEEAKVEGALGITSIEKTYKNGSNEVKLTVTGGTGGAGMGGGMQGLAGLAKMGLMMGGAAGAEQFRVDGRTAMMGPDPESAEISIFLDSDSIVMLKGESGVNREGLKKFAEALKLADLDTYLKGTAPQG